MISYKALGIKYSIWGMQIRHIRIKNFRSLKEFEIDNIPNLVVLAGQNGVYYNNSRAD